MDEYLRSASNNQGVITRFKTKKREKENEIQQLKEATKESC